MRLRSRHLGLFALTTLTCSGALAFSLLGIRWLAPTTTFLVGLPGQSPSGTTWSAALTDAMQEWNDKTSFTFVADPAFGDPCDSERNTNRIAFRANVCGSNFGNNVVAVTLTQTNPGQLGFGQLYQSDILFNSALTWDVYDGNRQSGVLDFRRVALHELGHALGLDHESTEPAIMAPSITNLHTVQADDIAGVNAIYSGTGACLVRDIASNTVRHESLDDGDCRVQDLFGGTDSSFVDVYRLQLLKSTTLDIVMNSTELDSVLILANADLGNLEIFDDFGNDCDARFRKTLPAGEYRLLANTYDTPQKCAGNTGSYALTLSDSAMPVLGPVHSTKGDGPLAQAVFSGGATADAGATFSESFGLQQAIDVKARIVTDPAHVGRSGRIYALVKISDGQQLMRNASGQFVPYSGNVASLESMRTGALRSVEDLSIVAGFRPPAGLAGKTVSVYVGYALAAEPDRIWYGQTPIRFTLAP